MFTPITLEQSRALPFWRRPVTLLFLMAIAMPVAFNTWSALLNNFVIEVASFDGADIGVFGDLPDHLYARAGFGPFIPRLAWGCDGGDGVVPDASGYFGYHRPQLYRVSLL